MREYQIAQGVPRAQVYDTTAYILCGLLLVGLICNWLIKPVDPKYFMTAAELEAERKISHERAAAADRAGSGVGGTGETPAALAIGAWLAVGIPLAWGVWITLEKAWVLFK
jgi:hypothetical protein